MAKNHHLTQRAQIRMQQLMAMLKDKVGTEVLLASELTHYEDDDQESQVEEHD